MKILSISIIFSLLTLGVFGFWSIEFMSHGGQSACPVSTLFGGIGECPLISDAFAIISHHLSGLKNFTLSTSAIGFIIALSLFLVFIRLPKEILFDKISIYRKQQRGSDFLMGFKKMIFYWLALHNKRDPHLLF